MKKIIVLLPLFFLLLFSAVSCEKSGPECYEPISILTRNAFVIKQIQRIDTFLNDSTQLDTTIISYRDTALSSPVMFSIGLPPNIIVYGSKNATQIGVPLKPNTGSIQYVLQYDTALAVYDTFTYFYQTKNHFISNACGYTNNFYIDSIQWSSHVVDSVAILKREIVSGNDKQILLYFF